MQPVALEKSSIMRKHHTYKKMLAIQAYQIFEEKMKIEDMDIESSSKKPEMMTDTLMKEILRNPV